MDLIKLLILLSLTSAFSCNASIGAVTELTGSSIIERESSLVDVGLKVGVQMDDEVRTGKGVVGITFDDDTMVRVSDHSELIIDDFVYDPESSSGSLGLLVTMGTVKYTSGKLAYNNSDSVDIQTPSATIAVRGTAFSMTVNELGDSLIVLLPNADGTVGEIIVGTDMGQVILNKAFQLTATFTRDAVPTKPVILDVTEDMINNLMIISPPAQKEEELFDELLIFKNLTSLTLSGIDSKDCFKLNVFSQIENLTISSSNFFDINISNNLLPKLKSIEFKSCVIDKIIFTNCKNLISIRSVGSDYHNERSLIKYFKVVNCPKLNEIQLLTSYNSLSYFEITNTPSMNFLNLNGNMDLCKLEINSTQHLKKIILSDCGLTSLPQFVKESKLCEFLDLEGNKLNEDSTDFKGLTNLLDLNLNKNKFTTVPPSIYDLKKLKSLIKQ